MEGLKDSLIQTVRERIINPMWGYIFLSWVGFNWKNIAILFFSNLTIEKRVESITNQENFYIHYLLYPIAMGCVLASLSPYLKWAFSRIHEYGESMLNDMDKKKS